MISIAIVDDNYTNLSSRKLEMEHSGKIKISFTARNGIEFLDIMKNKQKFAFPDIVLMDINMPDMDGIEAVRIAKTVYPNIEFVMLTVFDEYDKIFEAIKAGASGYLLKDENTDTLINYLEQVKEFKTVPMSPSIARKALKLLSSEYKADKKLKNKNYALSPREIEVLKGLVNGLGYKEIATELFVSPHTIRNQITNIYQKLHVSSKVDAVKLALKNNII